MYLCMPQHMCVFWLKKGILSRVHIHTYIHTCKSRNIVSKNIHAHTQTYMHTSSKPTFSSSSGSLPGNIHTHIRRHIRIQAQNLHFPHRQAPCPCFSLKRGFPGRVLAQEEDANGNSSQRKTRNICRILRRLEIVPVCACVYVCVCVYIYICIYIYIYIYICMCVCVRNTFCIPGAQRSYLCVYVFMCVCVRNTYRMLRNPEITPVCVCM